MDQNLQGIGVQELVVPAVLPRAVGLDLAQAIEIEQSAGGVDDVEARDARLFIGVGSLPARAGGHDRCHRGCGGHSRGAGRPGQDMAPAEIARMVRHVSSCPSGLVSPCPRQPGRTLAQPMSVAGTKVYPALLIPATVSFNALMS